MSKNNCLFQTRWLKDERFKYWIRKKIAQLKYAIIALKLLIRKRLISCHT